MTASTYLFHLCLHPFPVLVTLFELFSQLILVLFCVFQYLIAVAKQKMINAVTKTWQNATKMTAKTHRCNASFLYQSLSFSRRHARSLVAIDSSSFDFSSFKVSIIWSFLLNSVFRVRANSSLWLDRVAFIASPKSPIHSWSFAYSLSTRANPRESIAVSVPIMFLWVEVFAKKEKEMRS